MRVVNEQLDEAGKPKSTRITVTKSTLVEVDADGYTLEVEVTVTVAERDFTSPPRFVRCGFTGESDGEQTSFEDLAPETVKIGQREVPSRVQRIVSSGGSTKRVSTVHYNQDVAPFVLKRETVSVDAKTEARLGQTVVEVLATAVQRTTALKRKPGGEVKTVAEVRTVSSHPGGKTETVEWYSAEIPGAVVAHDSHEYGADGAELVHSTMELLDYGISDGKEQPSRPRLLRFRRWKRLR